MDFEQDVRRVLRRQPAPPGFAQKVVARLESAQGPRKAASNLRPSFGRWLAAAAATVLISFGGTQYYSHRRAVAEAERAHHDIMLALQITADKFALVKERLNEHGKDRVEELK
jgi:hypothetical protein